MASVRKLRPGDAKSPWVVEYTDGTGKRRRKTPKSGLQRDAEALRRSIDKDLAAGREPLAASGIVTVRQAGEFYLRTVEKRLRSKEIGRERYNSICSTFDRDISPRPIGAAKLSQVRPLAVQEWADGLLEDRKDPRLPSRVHDAVALLQQILAEAMRLEFVTRNAVKDVPPRLPKIKRGERAVPTMAEVRSIIDAASTTTATGLAVHIAVFTGLRLGEIAALRWSNIDLAARTICVRQSLSLSEGLKTPKTKAGLRTVPMPPSLAQALTRWKIQRAACSRDFLFSRAVMRGQKRTEQLLGGRILAGAAWKATLKAADLEQAGYTFHSLRHVAASLFIEQGLPPKHIQTIMGHSSVAITFDRYGHLLHDDGRAAQASVAIEQKFQMPEVQ